MNKNLIMLLQQWYSYQKELGDDVATYIVKIENFAHQLQTLGKKIPNQMIITKILIIFVIQILYCVWESTQSNERTLTNLISRLTIEETRIATEERLLLLPISINIKKISKKATLDLACVIIATGHWIKECRNRKAANEKYTGRKGEALIGAVSVEYNLKTSSDAWIGVQMNTCQIVASGSRHIKNSIQ